MYPGQISKVLSLGDARKTFIDSIPCATYDKNNSYSPYQTFEKFEALSDAEKSGVYSDVLKKLKSTVQTNADKAKDIYKNQGKYFNEQVLNEMLFFLQENFKEEKFPFTKFTHIADEEKTRRRSVQQRAFDLYLNKAFEDDISLEFNGLFKSVKTSYRGPQKFFRPDNYTEEDFKKAGDLIALWKRTATAASAHKEGQPFTEQELKDRKEMAKAIEDRLTAALNGAFEAVSAKTDEEFLAAMDKYYAFGSLLADNATDDFDHLVECTGLTVDDLSPGFVNYFRANSGMCVALGSAMKSRLSVMANPLYPEIEPEEMLKFHKFLDVQLEANDKIRESFSQKFSKPGIDIPPKDTPREYNFFKGYALAAQFTCGEDYVKDMLVPVLSSYANKYLGIADYKECNVVDENGIFIQEEDVLKNKLFKGESVNLLLKDARYMVPIKIDKWGSPVPTQTERSPFYQKIENAKKGLLLMNKKLPDELKMKFGDDSEKTEEEKLDEKFEKNFLDPEKVRLHIRAKAIIKELGIQGSTNKSGKSGVIKDGRAKNELDRLEEKFGKVPEEKKYFRRTFANFLKTDGSEEAQKYNESLYKSYLAGTDEAKKVLENELRKILSLDIKEIRDASETYESAVDYYEKHLGDLRIAVDMADLSLSKVFTSEFKDFATANATKFQALDNIKGKVFMASETAFMADAFDEPVYSNVDANNYLYNVVTKTNGKDPDGNTIGQPEYSVFLDKYKFELEQAEQRELPDDARTFPENGFVNGEKPILETTGKEYTRDDEYKLLFQREICEKGINGVTYTSLTDFVGKNKGNVFNVLLKNDSQEYKDLSKFLGEFQDRLAGKKEAFPKERQNDPKMIKGDYAHLKMLFDDYIRHKNRQLNKDNKAAFKYNSTDDNRYKFAMKMSEILGKVVEYKPLDLKAESEKTYGHKVFGKIVTNTADGGFGKNIVNEENNVPSVDEIFDKDTALLHNKLLNSINNSKSNQIVKKPVSEQVENEKQLNSVDKSGNDDRSF